MKKSVFFILIALCLLSVSTYAQSRDSRHANGGAELLSFDSSDCMKQQAYGRGLEQDGFTQQAYDTLRNFIENCYELDYAPHVFGFIGAAVGGLHVRLDTAWSPNTDKWLIYRKWLFKVLYLRTDTEWY